MVYNLVDYPNAYYNTQFYEQWELASKHYYMGSQRVASALVHDRYTSLGAGAPNPGAETDLQQSMLCMGLVNGSQYRMETMLEVRDYQDEVSQDDYDALDVSHCQSDPACLCGMDLYWSVGCENHNIMYWYHPDYLGNTEFVTDFNGDAYQSFWYNPWGETLRERDSRVGTWEGPWLFHAQHLDKETDNYYMLHRYYDPLKRLGWLSVDPMSAARPWLTPYNFVQNNPLMLVDPSGLLDGGPGDPNNEFPGQYVGMEAVVTATRLPGPWMNESPQSTTSVNMHLDAPTAEARFNMSTKSAAGAARVMQSDASHAIKMHALTNHMHNGAGAQAYVGFASLALSFAAGPIVGIAAEGLTAPQVFNAVRQVNAAKASTTGFRYMTNAELSAIRSGSGQGFLRGGRPGETFFTKDIYTSGLKAQQRLALPTKPTLRVEFEIINNPTLLRNGTKVRPAFGMPGGGAEFMSTDPIKVRLLNWQPL